MKKLLVVTAILAVFFIVFTAQSFAQEDPFEIGKNVAMSGEKRSQDYRNETENSTSKFIVIYSTEYSCVLFSEIPKSGKGTEVGVVRFLDPDMYLKYTQELKDKRSEDLPVMVSVTKDEAEQAAWRILRHFGY